MPCVEAGVLIYYMSTPAACRVVHELLGFLDSPAALIYRSHVSVSNAHVISIALPQAWRGGKDPPRAGWTHVEEAWKTGSERGEKTESAALLPSSRGPPSQPSPPAPRALRGARLFFAEDSENLLHCRTPLAGLS